MHTKHNRNSHVQTEGRGHGVFATTPIPKGQFVIEYCGEVVTKDECEKRMSTIYADMPHYYFFQYDTGQVIDACRKGSKARFINHSCDPNCRIEKWRVGGEYRVCIVADRYIKAGEEVTYDYKFSSFGDPQPCLCGAANCTGALFLPVFILGKYTIEETVIILKYRSNWSAIKRRRYKRTA